MDFRLTGRSSTARLASTNPGKSPARATSVAAAAGPVHPSPYQNKGSSSVDTRGFIALTPNVLISARSHIDATDEFGQTALMHAARSGALEAVEALIAAGAAVDRTTWDHETALMLAADHGHAEVACRLVLAGAKASAVDCSGRTSMQRAHWNGHSQLARSLTFAAMTGRWPTGVEGTTVG